MGRCNLVRDFFKDKQISCLLKCLVLVTVASLVIALIVTLVLTLEKPHLFQALLYVLIADIVIICISSACWVAVYFCNRNKEYGLAGKRRQEPKSILQSQSNISHVENQTIPCSSHVINEVPEATISASGCEVSPIQGSILSNSTQSNYEGVPFPSLRPNSGNSFSKYTLYTLDEKHTLMNDQTINSSQYYSRVPLTCCFDPDKPCPHANWDPKSSQKLLTGNQTQNSHSSTIYSNHSSQTNVPATAQPEVYYGTRRSHSLPRKRFRTLSMGQDKPLDPFRRSLPEGGTDFPSKFDFSRGFLRHSETVPRGLSCNYPQEASCMGTNEKTNSKSELKQNCGSSRRKRSRSAPSSTYERRSYLKPNEPPSISNRPHTMGDAMNDIEIVPPSPNINRLQLLRIFLAAFSISGTDEFNPDGSSRKMGSHESYFQPKRSEATATNSRNDLDGIFPIVRYEVISSNNYLVHISMVVSPDEFQYFLSQQEK